MEENFYTVVLLWNHTIVKYMGSLSSLDRIEARI